MRKLKKQLLRTMIACGLVVSMAVGSTVAYLSDAETAANTFTVGKVQIDLEEPGYPGNDSDEVKNIIPNQEIVKDPQIENTGNNNALVFLRVEIPQETFTELDADNNIGEKKRQDLFKLKNVSGQWELLRTETITEADGKVKTSYVYGYKKILAKGSTTDKLFQKVQMKNSVEKDLESKVEDIVITACAIQATAIPDINVTPGSDGTLDKPVLDQVYTIFLNQSGMLTSRPADEGNKPQDGSLGKILYELDGGKITGAKQSYTTADYGYMPPAPTKPGFTFTGWTPTSLPVDSTGKITFTAQWEQAKVEAKFDTGENLSAKIKKLANPDMLEIDFDSTDEQIQAIKKASEAPDFTSMTDANIVSAEDSEAPIYMWFEDGTLFWWSEDQTPQLNEDSPYVFCFLTTLKDISGLSTWDTSKVKNAAAMFAGTLVLDNISPLGNWDVSQVENMDMLFNVCIALDDVSPLSRWNVSQVKSMNQLFYACQSIRDASSLNDWDVRKVDGKSFTEMCGSDADSGIEPPAHPTWSKRPGYWDVKGTFHDSEITYSRLLDGETINKQIQAYQLNITAIKRVKEAPEWKTLAKEATLVSTDGTVPTYMWVEKNSQNDEDGGLVKWWTEADVIKAGASLDHLCKNLFGLSDISGLSEVDVSDTTSMNETFKFCSLKDVTPIANWNTKNVTSMKETFCGCTQLDNLSPLSKWNTKNVTSMKETFYGCALLDNLSPLSKWNTKNVTTMNGLFALCGNIQSLEGLEAWNTQNVTDMEGMFASCVALTDLSAIRSWNIDNVNSTSQMFYCISYNVDMALSDLSPLSNWDVSHITNMSTMFGNCNNLKTLTALQNWDVSHVTSMEDMFEGCTSLQSLSGLENWNTGNVTNMTGMFSGHPEHQMALTDASAINDWDITKVSAKIPHGVSTYSGFELMFWYCNVHPEFTKRTGTWDAFNTFTPTS